MKVVTEYKGVKYSLRPHGLRSKLLYYFSAFVLAFGGALLAASPAEGATTCATIGHQVIPGDYWWENGAHDDDHDGLGCEGEPGGIDSSQLPALLVKGNFSGEFWYVNPDETGRKPIVTDSGFVFGPADLVHHTVDLPLTSLTGGSFSASPTPSAEFDFSVEIRDANKNYGTLRWDGSLWSITIGAGSVNGGGPATDGTWSDASLADLMKNKRTKWGTTNFDDTTKVVSFGVGYTENPPGTVETIVSSVTFGGQMISLVKPAPAPSTVPGPVVTVTKVVTVTVPETSSGPTETASPSPSLGTTTTMTPQRIPTPSFQPAAADGDGGGSNLVGWGIGTAGVAGLALAVAGAVGIARSRRHRMAEAAAEDSEPGGRHRVDNSATQLVPTVDDGYDMSDYGPDAAYGPALGGYAGESYQAGDTEPLPPVEETPSGS